MQTIDKSLAHLQLTAPIIQQLNNVGSGSRLPWHGQYNSLYNGASCEKYSLINTLSLWSVGQINNYTAHDWASRLAWRESWNGKVREGEKGTLVVFFDLISTSNKIHVDYVFNKNQIEGLPTTKHDFTPQSEESKLKDVDGFVTGLESRIDYSAGSEVYFPSEDLISVPYHNCFPNTKHGTTTDHFYSALIRQHIHWSGHKSRMDRELSKHMEALVAELGTAYLCARFGINMPPAQQNSKFISSWVDLIKKDADMFFKVVKSASDAVKFLDEEFTKNSFVETA